MKSVVAYERQVQIIESEKPLIKPNHVLMKTSYSMVSPGTELTIINRSGAAQSKLGYSASGIAAEVGDGVTDIRVGQQVACYGAPYVNHSEYLLVPKQLIAPVPDHVCLKEASAAGLGAIAIHGLRQSGLVFGECAIVVGLGVIGQLIARIAHAAAVKVIAIDLYEERRKTLRELAGITVCASFQEVEEAIGGVTNPIGADAVLHCASGPQKELLDRSFDWIRDRGKIVIVGDMAMDFSRGQMFKKEADVVISRAGGPGRYDAEYEREGRDYPIGFVRWTEGRNMREYIRLLSEGRIAAGSLITTQVSLPHAADIYRDFTSRPDRILGAIISY
ncbi:zinc-dependent alcohol dehydrogenase [Paenibacillus arenilitoris]|uniref:Zinc-binding alcohol dehydrogenase n=1 Tax=Paenibacillus arenilitoris TaxID=2772299 RepID=A0A927CR29_9BACL|nr:zinc-binding alcohol dehydrogenase [Paenibacillus arenilitoris]MBD2870371.1 zinc-binding alcohol dehydrogenase [Paenibacillus arenilitoris]